MKNASAIERCIDGLALCAKILGQEPGPRSLIEAARTELAGYTEIGPCGHRKADWVVTKYPYPDIPGSCSEPMVFMDKNLGITMVAVWGGAQWIFKIVDNRWVSVRKVAGYDPSMIVPLPESGYCRVCREIEQAVAGAYEATAHTAESHEDGHHDCNNWLRETFCGDVIAKAIRSLDSSAAQLGKQRIREEALREAITALWERVGREEYGHAKAAVTLDIAAVQALIDKPGGR